MLNWIGKMLGASEIQAPAGATTEWLCQLEKLLALVESSSGQLRDGLAHDMLQYVQHGTPEAVLSEAGELGDLAKKLRLLRRYEGDKSEPDIYEHFEEVPVDMALRYARLLAALGPPHAKLYLRWPQGTCWPELLMVHAARSWIEGYASFPPMPTSLSVERLESMLVAAGLEPGELLVSAFSTPIPTDNWARRKETEERLSMAADLAGYADALDRHLELLRPLLLPKTMAQRRHIVTMLQKATAATLARIAPELCELYMTDSLLVQTDAASLLRSIPEAAIGPLRGLASQGTSKHRAQAQLLLAQCVESGVSVPVAHRVMAVPVIDWSAASNAVPPSFLKAFWLKVNGGIAAHNKSLFENDPELLTQPSERPNPRPVKLYDEDDQWSLQDYLASDKRSQPAQPRDRHTAWVNVAPVLKEMAGQGITPVALLKILLFFDLAENPCGRLQYPAVLVFNAMHRKTGRPTLLELACMMDDAGLSGAALRRNFCEPSSEAIADDWAPEVIWPYFMHHADSVARALVDGRNNEPTFRPGLFRALAMMPTLPDGVVDALFQLAWGSAKSARIAAQEALARYPGKEGRIVSALGGGKGAMRAAAAEWLARLGYRPALPALKAAHAKERQEAVKQAMLDALHALDH